MKKEAVEIPVLFKDKNFRDLLRSAQRRALTWEQFLAHPLPTGLSAYDCWRVMESLGRCQGVHLFEGFDGDLVWYRRTYELERLSLELDQLGRPGSTLDRAIKESVSDGLAHDLWLRELRASFDRSGITPEEILAPKSASENTTLDGLERIAANTIALEGKLDEFTDRPLERSLLADLRELLTEGVSSASLDEYAKKLGVDCGSKYQTDSAEATALRALEYAQEGEPHSEDLPVLRALIVSETLRLVRAGGVAYAPLSSLLRRLIFLKDGFDALAVLPFSETYCAWKRGQFLNDSPYSFDECRHTMRHIVGDRSLLSTVGLLCLERTANDAAALAEKLAQAQCALEEVCREDGRINARQRTILAKAFAEPGHTFTVESHRLVHGISYATSRRDLIGLQESGFLDFKHQGKAHAYVASKSFLKFRSTYHA
ncbi:MAG: hypothetical protein Q4A43_01740 [Coriobacteriia bacterium]|nr:hypothetical protein [Coriobacteriia bacterium]